ncbi:MAG: hypothetical protein V3R25_07175, partial [Nitrosomonadaceae bacterium]
ISSLDAVWPGSVIWGPKQNGGCDKSQPPSGIFLMLAYLRSMEPTKSLSFCFSVAMIDAVLLHKDPDKYADQ